MTPKETKSGARSTYEEYKDNRVKKYLHDHHESTRGQASRIELSRLNSLTKDHPRSLLIKARNSTTKDPVNPVAHIRETTSLILSTIIR